MAGYIRQSSFVDGDTITAALFNNEYNQLLNAFNNTTGHAHDGTTAEGPVIGLIGDAGETAPNNKVLIDTTNNFVEFYVQVASAPVQQLYIADGAIIPVTDSDIDLGTSSLYFKNAYIDSITTTGNIDVGGNLTVTGTTTFNGGTITMGDAATDNVVFGADVDSNIIPDDDDTYDLGSASQEWRNIYIDGTANIDSLVADTADINAGTIDGATIATSDITVGAGKTLDVSAGTLTLADNQISGDKVEGGTIAATTVTALTFGSLNDGTITATAFVDEDNMASDSATLIPTQQSVKAYVDSQVTAQDLDFLGDTGGALSIDLDSESLTVAGGTGLDTVGSGNTITVNIDSTVATLTGTQTLTNKTLTSPDVNTPDIDGGTIDSSVIGGTTAAAGTFTTLTANTSITGTLATAAQPNITSVGTLTGLTTSGDINFGDDDKAVFGAGSDLQIYHDGTDSFVADAGTGRLILRGSSQVRLETATGTQMISADDGGAAKLYHNGVKKFDTTATGIDVTGTATMDGLTVTGTLGNFAVDTQGAIVTLSRPSTSYIRASDASGSLRFDTGGSVGRLLLANNGDISFYEDTGTSQALFWDASAESLGIGTTSPTDNLDVAGGIRTTADEGFNASLGGRMFKMAVHGLTLQGVTGATNDFIVTTPGGQLLITNPTTTNNLSLIPVGNGNVGIGTTSPAYILDVTGASAGVAKFKRSSVGTTEVLIDTAGSGDAQLVFADNGTDSYAIGRDNTNGDFVIAASGALGTSNLINIESGGNVGIGTTSPAGILHLHKDAGTAYLKQTNTINGQTLEIGNAYSLYTGANGAHSAIASDSVLAFATADTERMRIDSSGNLLVGKTATALGTAGLEIFNTGVQWLTASNTRPLLLNRTGSDGDIQEFRKDGASVGSIGVVSGDRIYIATADGLGLQFDKDNNRIVPCDAAGASNSNVELGDSGLEFTNLWLSGNATIGGGVVFGDAGGSGTSSSNTLDSYEEGTWTPTLSGYTTNPTPTAVTVTNANYTKIGNTVFIRAYITVNLTNVGSGGAQIEGLPFTVKAGTYAPALFTHGSLIQSSGGYFASGTNRIVAINTNDSSGISFAGTGTRYLMISGQYETA
jgi:hypothetical protein